MKIARFGEDRIGVIREDRIHDITDLAPGTAGSWPPVGMIQFIAVFDTLKPDIEKAVASGFGKPLSDIALECPVPWPNKVIAFPANYHEHISEMGDNLISKFKASGQGFFLKSNSSLSGPNDPIVLPLLPDREIHHESELAIIIGKGGRDIPAGNALDHIFGYSCLIDAVVRGREERVMRKSFDTFCPLGPYIVTRDEIADPTDIELELRVNGDLRQKANTKDLIVCIVEMIAMASSIMTLYPGDVIASGTPAGVGPMTAGDRVDISIENVGAMSLAVVAGTRAAHPVWNKKD